MESNSNSQNTQNEIEELLTVKKFYTEKRMPKLCERCGFSFKNLTTHQKRAVKCDMIHKDRID